MQTLRVLAATLALAAATAVAQEEVPFVTTPDQVTLAMLRLAGVGPRDHVIDLGSGDGRIVITAARRFGASGLGVEIVPELVRQSLANAQAAGVAGRASFAQQDLFATELSPATVITMYLLPEVNLQLRPRLLALAPGTRIVSHDWDLGDWQADESVTVEVPDKTVGRDKFSRVYLWRVPARGQGLWCAPGASLEITQRFQRFSATLALAASSAPPQVFDGRIDGLTLQARGLHNALLHAEGPGLRIGRLDGAGAALAGQRLARANAAQCP